MTYYTAWSLNLLIEREATLTKILADLGTSVTDRQKRAGRARLRRCRAAIVRAKAQIETREGRVY